MIIGFILWLAFDFPFLRSWFIVGMIAVAITFKIMRDDDKKIKKANEFIKNYPDFEVEDEQKT